MTYYSYNYRVTDYYTGATINKVKLSGLLDLDFQVAFSDVYHSEFGRHKTMLLSQYFYDISSRPQPIAAFPVHVPFNVPYFGVDWVRNLLINTPFYWRDVNGDWVDNYFYVGDSKGTTSDPIEIRTEGNVVKASLLSGFEIVLPFESIPNDAFPYRPF